MDFTNFFFGKKTEEPKHEIWQSLRFRGAQQLQRTFTSSNASVCTFSCWVKRTDVGNADNIFGAASSASQFERLIFNPTSNFSVYSQNGGADYINVRTVALYRDPSAWYHLVYIKDTTQATSTDRVRIYINGERVTNLEATVFPGQDTSNGSINNNILHTIGRDPDTGVDYLDGYLAEIYFIDGKALSPTVFGNYDENDVWTPRDPEFEVNTQKYSAFLYGTDNQVYGEDSNQKLFLNGFPPQQLFDGDVNTGCNFGTGANGACWGYYKPSQPITDATQIRLLIRTVKAVRINGVDQGITAVGTTPSWRTFESLPSEITEIAIQGESSYTPQWHAIEVDGEILIDGPLYSGTAGDALFYDPQDSSDGDAEQAVDWSTTNPLGQGETNLFDGNLASAVGPSPGTAVNGCIIWKNPVPVTVNQGIRVYIGSGGSGSQRFYINEEYSGQFSMASPGWVNVSSPNLTPPYTLESMGFKGYSGNYSGFAAAIEVDGVILQNGVGLDYGANGFHLDFSDPNDIGADRSGNGNNFTPSGFNTDPVGIFSGYLAGSGTSYESDPVNRTATLISPGQAFDGNLIGQCQVSPGSAAWIYWTPTIICDTVTLIVNNDTDQLPSSARINGIDVSIPTETLVGSNYEIQFPVAGGTLTEFAYANRGGPNTSIFGMRVNGGAVLVDNTGEDYDLMEDSPTNNFATINPNETSWFAAGGSTVNSFQNANLTSWTNSSNHNRLTQYPQPGGKYYMECVGSNYYVGFVPQDYPVGTSYLGSTDSRGVGFYTDGSTYVGSAVVGTNPIFTTTDVIQLAYDVDAGEVWMGVNGVWHNSGDPVAGTNPTYTLPTGDPWQFAFNENSVPNDLNPGQQPFVYDVPDGFTGLSTKGMDLASIPDGRDHFQAIEGAGIGYLVYNEGEDANPDPQRAAILTNLVGGTPTGAFMTSSVIYDIGAPVTQASPGFQGSAGYWVSAGTPAYQPITTLVSLTGDAGTWTQVDEGTYLDQSSDTFIHINTTEPFRYVRMRKNTTNNNLALSTGLMKGNVWTEPTVTAADTSAPLALGEIIGSWNNQSKYANNIPTYTVVLDEPVDTFQFLVQSGWTAPMVIYFSEDGLTWRQDTQVTPGSSWSTDIVYSFTDGTPIKYARFMYNTVSGYNFGVTDPNMGPANGILEGAQYIFPHGLWWIKDRANANQHQFVDSVRGGNLALTCPTKSAQTSYSAPSGQSVAWCWKTDGNGLNTDAGFQILTYTGNDDSSHVIPHNLDPSKPLDLVIVKGYDAPDTSTYVNSTNFLIWHKDLLPNNYAYLNTSGALTGVANSFWTSTGLNTTLGNLTVGSDPDTNNGPSERGGAIDYVAYLWQAVPGFSAFGSVSSGQDSFAYMGFRPAFLLTKQIGASGDWLIWDTTRDINNPSITVCIPNGTQGEENAGTQQVDILSNGIKFRGTSGSMSGNLIYAAFAENPFSYPVTAR